MPDPTAKLVCKISPNAARSELKGLDNRRSGPPLLQIKLAARRADGKSNAELIGFLAGLGGCAKGNQIGAGCFWSKQDAKCPPAR